MSMRYKGGVISATAPTSSGPYQNSTASGIWTRQSQLQFAGASNWPTQGNLAPPTVTDLGNATGTNAPVITLTNAVPAGSLIFVFGSFSGNSLTNITVTSSVSQTWNTSIVTTFPGVTGAASKMFSAYSYNSAAMSVGATITASTTPSSGIAGGLITACVIQNVLTTSGVYDASVYNTATNDQSTGSSTITGTSSTQTNELLIYGFACNGYFANPTSFTQTSGWIAPPSTTNTGSSGTLIGGGYKITTASGQSAGLTNTTNGQNPWGLMVYGFKTS